MAKVVFVTELPTTLGKDEITISAPNFLDQVKTSNFKASGKKLTSQNHLNQIITLIRNKYDNDAELYESTMRIPYSKYVGLPFQTDQDVSDIVVRILAKHCPTMLDRVVEWNIKHRPAGTKTIFFDGPQSYANVFFKQGIVNGDVVDTLPPPTKKSKTITETTKAE